MTSSTTYETYTVKSGDTLAKIATFLWGDAGRWTRLAEANAIPAPYTLQVGQKLLVPVTYLPTIPITKGVGLNTGPILWLLAALVFWYFFASKRKG